MFKNKPYTYLIGWSFLNKWYYGVRYATGCDPSDFWKKYFTSSTLVKTFRETHGEPDIVEIRRVFDSPEQARLWEHKVLIRMNVKKDLRFINSHDMIGFPVMRGDANPSKRYDVREKLSIIKIGSTQSSFSKKKISDTKTRNNILKLFQHRKSFKPKRSKIKMMEKYIAYVESLEKRRMQTRKWLYSLLEKCKNIPLKEYPKDRRSSKRGKVAAISVSKTGTSWYYNPKTLETRPCRKNEIPIGWVKGMIKRTPNNNENHVTKQKLSMSLTKSRANETDDQKRNRLEKYHATICVRREGKVD